jgi:hypothetical protein
MDPTSRYSSRRRSARGMGTDWLQRSARSQLQRSAFLSAGGVVAGAIGTVTMDTLLYLRSRRAGGKQDPLEWEFSSAVTGWDDVSAPGQVGKRLIEGFLGRELPDKRARSVQNAMHWATGVGWGALFGLVAGPVARPAWAGGLIFGPIVWLSGYAVLPIAKIYEPIWDYDAKTLTKDLSALGADSLGHQDGEGGRRADSVTQPRS